MRFLPVFLDLQGGAVVVVGAGAPAQTRLRVLSAAGARLRYFDTSDNPDRGGHDPSEAGKVELCTTDPLETDLHGVAALVCAGAGEIGLALAARARSLGVPVNVMDDPDHSTFIFPAIVDRGDVVVAIGTGGSSPVVARRVRERIEAALPSRIGELARFIGRFRKEIHARIDELPLRRRFWERVIDGRIGALVLAGREHEAAAALNGIGDPASFAVAPPPGEVAGSVTLVGAGPGDPDLLTVKALHALQDADIVFHDDDVQPRILDRVRRDAARVAVTRGDQEVVSAHMIDVAKAGRRAVRLKLGDACVSGRFGRDIAALREAGVAHVVVPGVAASVHDLKPLSPAA